MPWIGSAPTKTFQRTDGTRTGAQTWQEADAADVDIVSPDHDTHDQDIADSLSLALLRDGGNTAVANIPMGGFRFTALGDAAALTQAVTAKQQLNSAAQYCGTAGGTANALLLTTGFSASSYTAGMTVSFIVGTTNTGAATVNVDGLGVKNLVRADGANTGLAPADLVAGAVVEAQYDGTRFQVRSNSLTATSGDVLARIVKAGSIVAWPHATVPAGWLECYGQAISRATYAELFANIGTTHGAGDGSTTFNLPDMRGRTIFGEDDMGSVSADRITSAGAGFDGDTLGASGGAQTVTLARANLPNDTVTTTSDAHRHFTLVNADTAASSVIRPNSATSPVRSNTPVANDAYDLNATSTEPTVGRTNEDTHDHTFPLNGGVTQTAVNKMPPAIILKWIILALPAAAAAGTLGVNGFQYMWNTATSGDPALGGLLVNNATLASATSLNISETDALGSDVGPFLATFDDSTSAINGFIHVCKVGAPGDFIIFATSGSIADNGSYDTLTVSHVAGNGTFASGQTVSVLFYRTGDKGDQGDPGPTGESGIDAGIRFAFDDSTGMADPGAGEIRFNNAALASVTAIAVSDLSAETGNPDVSAFVLTWDDSTTTTNRGTLTIKNISAPQNVAIYAVSGGNTDNSGWTEIAVTHVASSGSFGALDPLSVAFTRTGNAGANGSNGSNGANGTDGVNAGLRWLFDSSTTTNADPGSGDFRLNNATLSSVTEISISYATAESGGPSAEDWVKTWDDSTTTTNYGSLVLSKIAAPQDFAVFTITSSITDGSTYGRFTLSYVKHAGSFSSADAVSILFVRTGDKGSDGLGAGDVTASAGFGTDNVVIRADGTGKGVQSTGVAIDDSNNMTGVASLGVSSIELGHATQNTLTASSGILSCEGVAQVNLSASQTLTNKTLTSPVIGTSPTAAGATWTDLGTVTTSTFANTGLRVLDTNASHVLSLVPGSNITANRALTLTTGDSDRTLTISGDATISQDYSTTGSPTFATPTVTGINIGSTSTTITESSAGVIAVEGVPLFSGMPQNSQSSAYTLVLADAQKHILHPTADNNARTFTIPANSSVAYPVGTVVTFINQINVVTIAITSDTLTLAGSGSTGSRSLAANGIATAIKIASTSWVISGVGLT